MKQLILDYLNGLYKNTNEYPLRQVEEIINIKKYYFSNNYNITYRDHLRGRGELILTKKINLEELIQFLYTKQNELKTEIVKSN